MSLLSKMRILMPQKEKKKVRMTFTEKMRFMQQVKNLQKSAVKQTLENHANT